MSLEGVRKNADRSHVKVLSTEFRTAGVSAVHPEVCYRVIRRLPDPHRLHSQFTDMPGTHTRAAKEDELVGEIMRAERGGQPGER